MKRFLFSTALLATGTACWAQSVPTHEMYVDFGETKSENIVAMLDKWQPGQNFSSDADYKDENFFIARVPLKQRFFNEATQANKDLNDENNKNLCWCVPIGEMTKKWGPLPRWNFDGDNFNMWQYINIHANWSNSWWRVPGSFNDAAHKNGVRTGCLYFIDWASSVTEQSNAGRMLGQLCAKDSNGKFKYAKKLIQFLRYYGIDGIGLNPEGSWSSTLNENFSSFLAECHKEAKALNFPFHVEWYAFVSNYGALSDNGCQLTIGGNDKWFQKNGEAVTDVFFLNYNWSDYGLAASADAAKQLGRSTFDVYAGFDQQGRGYGGTGNAGWNALMKHPVSIVVWGGHDRSQLYASSTEGGNSDLSVQQEYQKKQELLFTGGNRNVLNLPPLNTKYNVTPTYNDLKDWHGYAKAVREQSTLSELPFVTRFGLGNGLALKKEGVTTFKHKWYNLGMQDYLPTWRWWIDNGDGKTVPADAIQADFTFDDAWYGGSCLKLHGATAKSHIRLFNTRFKVTDANDEFSITYKLKNGATPNLKLTASKIGSENNFASVAVPAENVERDTWTTVKFKASDFGLKSGETIACLGLEVAGTEANYELLLGEYSIIPANFSETPVQPVIKHAEVMKRVYNRADIKVTFDLPFNGQRPAEYEGCPIYNEEVGAWYYEIYVKQGEQQRLVATTTTWASYVVDAPLDSKESTIQIGVRAVGRDGKTLSDITWSKELESPLTIIETLTLDKDIIKPNEEFTIGFEDPNHAVADISILNSLTEEVVASVKGARSLTTSLPETGSYDVTVTSEGNTTTSRALILVTPEATGRLPQINDIKADNTEFAIDENNKVNFTADINKGTTFKRGNRDMDCTVSKSLYMKEPYQLTVDSKVMSEYNNTSFALWFKVEKFEHASLGTLLMTKVNRNYPGSWTEKVWGEMWTAIRPAHYAANNNLHYDNAENELSACADAPVAGTYNYEHNNDVDGISRGYSLSPNTWYHCCVVKEGRRLQLYLNGKRLFDVRTRGCGPKDWKGANFYVGGSMTNLASFTGWVDEVQVWSKALTETEVREAMNGYIVAPEGLEGYFTFEEQETDQDGNIYFPNMGNAAAAVPGAYMTIGKEENGYTTDIKQNQLTTALGVPAVEGSLPITFESSKWMLEGAQLDNFTDNSASATYNKVGTFPVTLTITNSWGSTTKTINDYIVVKESTGIDNATNSEGYMVYPRPFEDKVNLLFAEEGNFEVMAFDAQGKRVAQRVYQALAGEVSELSLAGATPGTYIITILKDGKCVRSVKVQMR